jgi:hypothetical protein
VNQRDGPNGERDKRSKGEGGRMVVDASVIVKKKLDIGLIAVKSEE